MKVDAFGHKVWYNTNEDIHNETGPAVLFRYGGYKYVINGKIHRENGPAIAFPNTESIFSITNRMIE